MKRELALQLLQTTLPGLGDDSVASSLFRELQFVAEYKYNKYEMYHPGRLFLENLYLWLQQFTTDERDVAIDFVRHNLVYVSRGEFQQLASVLYFDVIRREQRALAGERCGHASHMIRRILESAEFRRIARGSLYVGMSDGARIDYLRRHNLDIGNEQVLPYYETSDGKIKEILRDLRIAVDSVDARMECLFLLDDFCGSGRTLLREVVVARVDGPSQGMAIPPEWRSRVKMNVETGDVEMLYQEGLSEIDLAALRSMGTTAAETTAMTTLLERHDSRDTMLKGALQRASAGPLANALAPGARVAFCPLLATEYAVDRLKALIPRLPGPFGRMSVLPAALLDKRIAVTNATTAIGALCEKYYSTELEDRHTGCVKFGFDNCGLPLVLHHNTPNNSLYVLWARKRAALFVRHERHGREGG